MARRDALIVGERPGRDLRAALAAPGAAWDGSVAWLGDGPITDHTVDELGVDGLDLVVHCAYPSISRRRRPLVDLTADEWRAACDEPFEGAIRLARGTHRHLAARNGTIVFVVPVMASAGADGFAPLATAAEGVRILAKSLARTWGGSGIRAHALTLDPHHFLDPTDAEGIAEANALHDPPLGAPDAADVAGVIDLLTADPASTLTGTSLVVDGGLWMPG